VKTNLDDLDIDVEKLELKPGDVIHIRLGGHASAQALDTILKQVREVVRAFPDNRVVLTDASAGIELEIARAA
jgi:hypothetical protein